MSLSLSLSTQLSFFFLTPSLSIFLSLALTYSLLLFLSLSSTVPLTGRLTASLSHCLSFYLPCTHLGQLSLLCLFPGFFKSLKYIFYIKQAHRVAPVSDLSTPRPRPEDLSVNCIRWPVLTGAVFSSTGQFLC